MADETERKERQRRPLPEPLIYRQRDLLAVLSCSRQQLDNMMREEGFPAPIPLSVRAKGWLVGEVREWLDDRRARRSPRAVCPKLASNFPGRLGR